MKPLTRRQAQVLASIEDSVRERGYAPTWREIADALGIRSTNAISEHLVALERKGRICQRFGVRRAMTVIAPLTTEERRLFGFPHTVSATVIQPSRCAICDVVRFAIEQCPLCGRKDVAA